MTAQPTNEEMDRCERMLTDCRCLPDYSDRGRTDPTCMACQLGSEVIDTFKAMRAVLTERQAARDGVTDEIVDIALTAYDEFLGESDLADYEAMRAALQSIAQPVRVPDGYIELNMSNYSEDDVSQLNDWAIRAHEVLSTSPQPQQAVPDGYIVKCKQCNGHGQAYIETGEYLHRGGYFEPPEPERVLDTCPTCDGAGFISAAPAYNGKKEG